MTDGHASVIFIISVIRASVRQKPLSRCSDPSTSNESLHQLSLFIQNTAPFVIVREYIPASKRSEQRRFHSLTERRVPHIHIRVGRKRARLRAAVRVDVEEASPRRHTASGALSSREGDIDHFRMIPAEPCDLPTAGNARSSSPGASSLLLFHHRDKFHKDHQPCIPDQTAFSETHRRIPPAHSPS